MVFWEYVLDETHNAIEAAELRVQLFFPLLSSKDKGYEQIIWPTERASRSIISCPNTGSDDIRVSNEGQLGRQVLAMVLHE